jgi:hypothetical protein
MSARASLAAEAVARAEAAVAVVAEPVGREVEAAAVAGPVVDPQARLGAAAAMGESVDMAGPVETVEPATAARPEAVA